MSTLTVGTGQAYSTIGAAVTAAKSGDIIQVQAGTYTNDFSTINKDITIQGVGGLASIVATASPPNGKAILTVNGNITLDHIELSGARVPDNNGAGIRFEGGTLTLTNSYIHDNQEGILANSATAGTGAVSISNSEFARNGAGDGYSHNLYVGDIASLTIDSSYFHEAIVGHEIKSRAERTTITNSRIFDLAGTASYSIDLPNGGVAVIQNNVIQQGPNSQNPNIIAFGEEGSVHAGSSLLVTGNTILNDLSSSSARAVWNAAGAPAVMTGNSVFGLGLSAFALGPVSLVANALLSSEPALVTTSPIGGSTSSGGGTVTPPVVTPTAPATGGGIVPSQPGAAPAIVFSAPVGGVSTVDVSSLNISTLLGAGYSLQFVSGVQAVQLVDGTISVGTDTNQALIQRLYLGLLGRASDPSGIAGFNQALTAGASASGVAAVILGSAEYAAAHGAQTNAQYVAALFQAMLGRAVPGSDQAGFTASLATTMSRADLAVSIANSAEAKTHNAGATARLFVRDPAGTLVHEVFQTGLGREVELPSLTPMASGLRTGTQTPAQLAQIVASSAEFAGLHGAQSNAAYVANLYQTALGRTPGQTELLGWSNTLASGAQTRADVLLGIGTSAEAQGHLTAAL